MFIKLREYIGRSVTSKDGNTSSTRISSYFILGAITLISLVFVVIEIINAIITWKTGVTYVVPGEHIAIFGMILTHHLALLGINKTAETKIEQAKQDKEKMLSINPKNIDTNPPGKPNVFNEPEEELPSD